MSVESAAMAAAIAEQMVDPSINQRRKIVTREVCPLCHGRGTRRKVDGPFKLGKSMARQRCHCCSGVGTLPRGRLQRLVRVGLQTEEATKAAGALQRIGFAEDIRS